MSSQPQHRQPRGVPAGGQFAHTVRGSTDLSLEEDELAGRDPVGIDTELVQVLTTHQRASMRLLAAWDRVHQAVRDQRVSGRARAPWQRTDEDCPAELEARVGDEDAEDWQRRSAVSLLAEVDEHSSALQQATARVEELEGEHDRRGWSRFFHVPGGHIHSSRSCSTCRPTTQFGFACHLSGRSEAEAVADLGPVMCTVCFPSAPVEWTIGLKKDEPPSCPGSGKAPAGEVRRFGMSSYAACPECGEQQMVVGYGSAIRKHRPGS